MIDLKRKAFSKSISIENNWGRKSIEITEKSCQNSIWAFDKLTKFLKESFLGFSLLDPDSSRHLGEEAECVKDK